jgi:soluble lytic murein transglycosylase-like protein
MSATAVVASCVLSAASLFDLPPGLLVSIAKVESDFNAAAIAHANNGTRSVGLMQINSSWFPRLEVAGIREQDLFEPCVSVHVGAWILRQEVDRFGFSWEAIGAYYAGPYTGKHPGWRLPHYREYAHKVLRAWKRYHREEQRERPLR